VSERNPDRDYPIIAARQAVLDACETLATAKSPYAALAVQDRKQRWDTMRKLELVKKGAVMSCDIHESNDGPYSIETYGDNRYNVVRNQPTVVAKELRWEEAVALCRALNEENGER
jgi:hypothetical protein